MTSEIAPTQPTASAWHFVDQFPSSLRGARRARLAASEQLDAWGWNPALTEYQDVVLLVGELAANAVTHGRVAGRYFQLHLAIGVEYPAPPTMRIEVSDARGDKSPSLLPDSAPTRESGRGLLLVDALSSSWGTSSRFPSGKTVWVELALIHDRIPTRHADCPEAAEVEL